MSDYFIRPENVDITKFRQNTDSCLLASDALGSIAVLGNTISFDQVFIDYFKKIHDKDYSYANTEFLEKEFGKLISETNQDSSAESIVEIHEKLGYSFKCQNHGSIESNKIIRLICDKDTLSLAIIVILFKHFVNDFLKPGAHYMLFGFYGSKIWGIETGNSDIFGKGKYPRLDINSFKKFVCGGYQLYDYPITIGETIILSKINSMNT